MINIVDDKYQKVLDVASKKLAVQEEKKEIADILSDLSEQEKNELSQKVNQKYLTTENKIEKVNLSGMGLYIKGIDTKVQKTETQKEQEKNKTINKVEVLRHNVIKVSYTTNTRDFQIVIYKENNGFKIRINEKIGNERKKIKDKEANIPYKKQANINNNLQELLINIGKTLDYYSGTSRKKIPEEIKEAYKLLQTETDTEIKLNKPITENIKYQKEYLEKGFRDNPGQKTLIEGYYQKQKPMKKETKLVVSFPVDKYEDIEKTLESYTTAQTLNKDEYEMVILFNKANETKTFDKETKDKLDKFIKEHPEYNITVFEHTFDFFTKGKQKNMGKIYKLLGDMILYRNIQRINTYPDIDTKKVDQLIMRMGGADSQKKNPEFLKNLTDQFDNSPNLARMTTESRLDPELVQNFPLLQIDATLESAYNRFRSKGKINSMVGNGTFKAHLYAEAGGHDSNAVMAEDVDIVSRMKKRIVKKGYEGRHLLKKNAIDNSADRPINFMLQGQTYFDRYNKKGFTEEDTTKDINWEKWAIENKGKDSRLDRLEFTKENLEREFSSFYRLKFVDIQKRSSQYIDYVKKYKKDFGKEATTEEKEKKIREIFEHLFSRSLARGLGLIPRTYTITHGDIKKNKKTGRIYPKKNNTVSLSDEAMTILQTKRKEKIDNGSFKYW